MAKATQSVSIQMEKILDEFSDKVNEVLKEAGEQTSEETAEKLRMKSPIKTGAYASGWTTKKQGDTYIVHNPSHYQLTHLLENGHVIRNKYGTYGRWSPSKKHIKPVETWANKEYQRKIEQGLSS